MHSPKYEKVLNYYLRGLWNEQMVRNASGKWITPEEVEEIINEKLWRANNGIGSEVSY